MCLGGLSVFMHLQHWERIFNGFGHITSGITLEFIGVIVFMICLAVFFLMGRRAEDGEAPKWCGVFAMIVGAGMTAVTGDSYLMPALPVWDTPLLVVFYLCNMLAMGGIALLIIGAAVKSVDGEDFASKTALVGLAVQLVVLIAYAASITFGADSYAELGMYFDPTLPDVAMVDVAAVVNVLGGTYAPMFWAGAIVLGTIVPCGGRVPGQEGQQRKEARLLYRCHRMPDGWRHHVALHHLPGRAARVRHVLGRKARLAACSHIPRSFAREPAEP